MDYDDMVGCGGENVMVAEGNMAWLPCNTATCHDNHGLSFSHWLFLSRNTGTATFLEHLLILSYRPIYIGKSDLVFVYQCCKLSMEMTCDLEDSPK